MEMHTITQAHYPFFADDNGDDHLHIRCSKLQTVN